MARPSDWRRPALAHAVAALALWPVPLLGMLHAEGAAVMAFASFFIAGITAVGAFSRGEGAAVVARRHVALLAIPLVLLSFTALWRPNCGIAQGFILFALLVPPCALLAVGLASALTAFGVRRPRLVLALLGVVLAAVPAALVLKFRPQLFVYNPVFGAVLGPIYDVELAIRPGLLAHQVAVLVGAVGCLALARWRRQPSARARRVALLCGAVIAMVSLFSTPLGITQSEASLRRALPGRLASEHVVLHFSPGTISAARQRALLDEAEFRLWQIHRALGIAPSETVHVYLYPDPETKAALIGSRETSVVPVWLPTPQVHLLDERADGDLGHELVHVVAREVGGAITGATWTVGLVEGLAVALEASEGAPSAEQRAAASLILPPEQGGAEDPATAVRGAMDPFGFWTGRAGASYSTTGAFTRWLLDTYGPEPVLAVYGGADWEDAYGQPLARLAADWAEHLRTVEVSDAAVEAATWWYGVPSLFEVKCPHHVPRWQRFLREGDEDWEAGRLWAAGQPYTRAALEAPDSLSRAVVVSRLALARALLNGPERDLQVAKGWLRADTARVLVRSRVEVAHASALEGEDATALYRDALSALPEYAWSQRVLLRSFATLSPADLRMALFPAADSTHEAELARGLEASTPAASFLAALRYSEAGDASSAWRAVQRALGTGAEPVLALIAARLAYRAGEWDAADDLARRASESFSEDGRDALVDLADDLRQRVAWKRAVAG